MRFALGLGLMVAFAVSLVVGFQQQTVIVETFVDFGYTAHTAGLLGALSILTISFGCAGGGAALIADECP